MTYLNTQKLRLMVFGALAFLLYASSAFAVGVKPLRTELTINPGESQTATIKVINSENKTIKVTPDVEVFVANDEAGFPVNVELEDNDPRNIAKWITFEEPEITLAPNSEKETTFTITVPTNAEPGGKYASVVYEPVVEEGEGLQIRSRVASLILVTVTGEENIDGELQGFDMKDAKVYSDNPVTFATSFLNTGNIHVKPTGEITLFDQEGNQLKEIARYKDPETNKEILADSIPVNLSGGHVLPGSNRVFTSEWTEGVQEGKYTAKLSFVFGDKEPVTEELTFDTNSDVSVENFQLKQESKKAYFEIKLKNSGQLYERPKGSVEIKNEFNSTVATIDIPADADYITPSATGTITLNWLDREVPAGEYTATLNLKHGLTGEELTAKTDFTGQGAAEGAENFLKTPLGMGVSAAVVLALLVVVYFAGRSGKKK